MIDRDDADGTDRMDLAAAAPRAEEMERVIAGAMARLPRRPVPAAPPAGALDAIAASAPARWIAAAAVALAAASLGASASRGADAVATDVVAQWAAQQHVPSNAELLLAFQGYQR
jgi:hypothetical protein